MRATVALPVPTSRAVRRMPVPASRKARTAASRSADSLGRPKALPLLVPFARAPGDATMWAIRRARLVASILPKAIEALGVHLGVAGRIGDLAMTEVGGEGAGIDALVDQLEPGAVPQQ